MLVTIATYSFPHEAHLAKARLDALGIPCFIADEHTINMQWLYSNALGGVRLQVPQVVAAEALAALNEEAATGSAEDAAAAVDATLPDAATTGTGAGEPEPPAPPAKCPYCGGVLGEPYALGQPPALARALLPAAWWPTRRVRKCNSCGDIARA